MGDRVVIICTDDGQTTDGAVYSHWQGDSAADLIREAAPRLRKNDASYSAGAICAHFWNKADRGTGYVSVGILPGPPDLSPETLNGDYSHGDAGVFVINTNTGEVTNYRKYGEPCEPFKLALAD